MIFARFQRALKYAMPYINIPIIVLCAVQYISSRVIKPLLFLTYTSNMYIKRVIPGSDGLPTLTTL